jgi:hypothetical protein
MLCWQAMPGLARAFAIALLLVLPAAACDGGGDGDDGPRGEACSADGDCAELACVADLESEPEDLAPMPLVCGDPLGNAAPGTACETAGDCKSGICVLAGACAAPCSEDADCGSAERCAQVFARNGADALQPLSACVALADVPRGVHVESEIRSDALEPPSSELTLPAADADADATTLYVVENLSDNWPDGVTCRPPLCVRALRTRDDPARLLFDATADYSVEDPPLNPVATGDHLHPAVVMLPSGARGVLSDAGYTLALDIEEPGDARVTRVSGAHAGGGVLDLNVFYVGALDWQPEGARGPELLADALDVVDEILGQADIAIGEVRQIAVPGELPERGTANDASQGFAVLQVRYGVLIELPALFRLSAGAANSAVNLFFVSEIEPRTGNAEPEAQSGGIPGPLGLQGTSASGIAISTDMMAGDARMLGRTLAHELAHYLGLFHVSESDGSVLDPLADTPECRTAQDTGGDGLTVEDCAEHGADNLMFWAKTSGTLLTEQQRSVLRSAVILR